ncbi:FtsX-like permease family protein [Auraticoccus monumenti]|uniref:Putative ABC transport system permease protein n=1 Tax=Auraticoccus monumenti TaxID=675864 RepID=A0A1G6Z2Q7_9ACTN|nr:ABC transporter permease [Auraticoccus monumenti]SDD96900.1 putative ABC transport system permease protein [Auraticoccus monumenti]
MRAALRSLLVVNRSAVLGAGVVVALAAVLLATTAAWLEAGIRQPEAPFLSTVAGSFAGTLVLITVFMVASVFAGVLRQRRGEFALLRAVGATARQIRTSVTTEVLLLLALVAPLGAVVGTLLAPLVTPLLRDTGIVPGDFTLSASAIPVLTTLLVLVPTGFLAARLAARAATRTSPTDGLRASVVDAPRLSRGRIVAAAVTGALGLLAAGTPFVVPGTVGAASGASSAILMIVAAALAGPLLVHRAARRGLAMARGSALELALANTRGFSSRFSAAVIPLALLVGLGWVQTGTDTAVARAAEQQLRAGISADLVVMSPAGVTVEQAAAVATLPGVAATTSMGDVSASVRTEAPDEDVPALDGLAWEPTSLRTLSADHALVDPSVRSGSLDELAGPDTIAVSSEALALSGTGLGDTVDLRVEGGPVVAARVVAVYDRGLAFGDYLVRDPGTGPTGAVLVDASAADPAGVRTAVEEMGLTVSTEEEHLVTATASADGERRLSLVLIIALLAFVGVAAANTLVTTTRSRRDELALLHRTGATRGQLLRMVLVETAFIALASVALGTLAVVPALLGVGYGLGGGLLSGIDLAAWAGFSGAAIVIAVIAVLPVAWRMVRTR